jgi:hypothetical protein
MNAENGTITLIQPPAGLLTQVTNPNTNQPDYTFPLQNKAWIAMQDVVTKALAFPLNKDNFEDLYGTFQEEGSVEMAVSILGRINTTAAKYGDPQTLINSLSDFQQANNPPSSIYGHAVWLAAQIKVAAQQIGNYLNEGLNDIKDESDPTQRLQDLTDLLVGVGGVNSYAVALQGYIGGIAGTITFTAAGSNGDTVTINGVVITLVTSKPTGNEILIGDSAVATAINLQAFLAAEAKALKLANYAVSGAVITIFPASSVDRNSFTLATSSAAITVSGATLGNDTGFQGATTDFYNELNLELNDPNDPSNSLGGYLNQSSNVLTDAQSAVSSDQQQIEQLNDQIKQLNDEYIGFTATASSSPVFLVFGLVGILIAIADAATFGVLATKVKQQLDAVRSSLKSTTEDYQKKAALVTQVGGFNQVAGDVQADGQKFLSAISGMLSSLTDWSVQISTQLGALTPEDLVDWDKFQQRVGFQAALTGWQQIETAAETFFTAGFLQYKTGTSSWLSA